MTTGVAKSPEHLAGAIHHTSFRGVSPQIDRATFARGAGVRQAGHRGPVPRQHQIRLHPQHENFRRRGVRGLPREQCRYHLAQLRAQLRSAQTHADRARSQRSRRMAAAGIPSEGVTTIGLDLAKHVFQVHTGSMQRERRFCASSFGVRRFWRSSVDCRPVWLALRRARRRTTGAGSCARLATRCD